MTGAWQTTHDAGAFLDAAGGFLRPAPAENSVVLTAAESLRARGGRRWADAPLGGWWTATGGAVAGAFLQTPPFPLLVTTMPDAAVLALADTLADDGRTLPGVTGDRPATEAFAAAWAARTGTEPRPRRRMRLHRLATLVPPDPPPDGHAVVASAEHRELLVDWYRAFAVEIDELTTDVEPEVDDRLGHGGLTLWLAGGAPVSVAGVTRAVAGAARVAPVYTPPVQRGRGYAAAATAAVTRAALDAGAAELLLYTDLANPTANRLYERLGYRPVEDRVVLGFDG